jgi:succinyl-diaminopimelate desuccinylase
VNAQTALIDMLAGMPFAETKGYQYICALSRLFPHGDYNGRALGIAMSDEESGELTLNFGVLGFTDTEFSGNFDSRTPACADETDLTGMVREAFEREGINLTNSKISKCHHTPQDSEFVQTLLRIYEEYTGNPGGCLIMGGQTYVHEIEGGVAFGCKMPGVNNNVHGANEFTSVEHLIVSAKMFAQAIIDICGE